ncbi:P-loop containing nucleoside triphosphate hydrolase protein [Podospora didyma]|uniref:P-loop containing nucleoside triphosphate hydrolase protein n=1 Tax=Podospora didyma TaxID=330526 RepID=A0AAE0NR14_9PEZI|nr:P-loop containing nucleoside triphosphate hydrolase protein [Podospora didyma]
MKRNLIKDVLTFFDNQALYQSLQVPWKRGIILHGLPGNGKTISIKALINSLDARSPPVPSLYVKSFDGCSGQKWCINAIFSQARRQAPCLLIFEDLDSLVEDKTRSYFLNEVDGLESNEGILMIGSTNHLEKLDPAITKRPSRFDRKYHFKVPNEASRASYAEFWAGKFATRDDVDFPDEICPIIAKLTADFSFAYLQELFLISLLALARGDDEEEYQEEEEDEKEGSGAPSDSGSATDAVVVPRPVTGSEDNGSAANAPAIKEGESKDEPEEKENEKKQKPKPKSKRVMPVVEIPEHLQDHRLLKIIKKQTKMLLEQMDSTSDATDERDEEDGGSRSKRKMRNQRSIMRTMASMRAC